MPGMSRSRRRYSRDDATPLINAVLVLKEDSKKGWARFQEALTYQADVDETDGDGFTALMYAVRLDLPTAIPALVKAGATVDLRDQDGNTPFHYASMFRQWLVMSVLLKLGAHIDALDQNGFTALLSAVDAQDGELVDVLIKMGANPNDRGRAGIPPVVLALSHKTLPCSLPILKRLLEAGADPNVRDVASGATALMRACDPNRPSVEAVRLLLAHGADHALTAKNGRTAVHECLRSLSSLPCLSRLLEAGADPNVLDNQGFTPLSLLGHHVNKLDCDLDHKFLATLSILLQYGADPNVLGLRASPNFIMASAVGKSCSYQALRMLLAAGVEPVPSHESARIPRPSPLAFAFDLGKAEVARLLTDGLVYNSRDTVHITKYCLEPPHMQQFLQQSQQHHNQSASLAASNVREQDSPRKASDSGSVGGGRSSPSSSSLGSKGRASSSGSLLNNSAGSSPSGTPRSSISGQLFSQNSHLTSSVARHSPPRRCNSNTQPSTTSDNSNNSNGHTPVHTSSSSPSLSYSTKAPDAYAGAKNKTNGSTSSRGTPPCHNMVFPDRHGMLTLEYFVNGNHNVRAGNDKQNGCDGKSNSACHQHHSGKSGGQSNGTSVRGAALANGSDSHCSNGRASKHRSSSSSRHGSHQSLSIPRRPSLTEVFSFNSRNSSPGPSQSRNGNSCNSSSCSCGGNAAVHQALVEAELHELALQVCQTVPSLQQLCRRAVHRSLNSPPERHKCIKQLPVSASLHRYILFQGPEYQLHG